MARPSASTTGIATLRLNQVIARTGLSKSNIYERLNPKSSRYDPTFPRQFKLGISAVGWLESEIEAWVDLRAKSDGTRAVQEGALTLAEESSSPTELEMKSNASKGNQDLFAKRVATARKFLEERAKNATLVRYSELMERMMLSKDSAGDWEILDMILSDLSRASYAENKVLLAAHVRRTKEPWESPRDNFFRLANELGLSCANKAGFLEGQLKELFGYYASSKFRTEKKLSWIIIANRRCMALQPD